MHFIVYISLWKIRKTKVKNKNNQECKTIIYLNTINIDLQILHSLGFLDGLSPGTTRQCLPHMWPKIKEIKKVLPCI